MAENENATPEALGAGEAGGAQATGETGSAQAAGDAGDAQTPGETGGAADGEGQATAAASSEEITYHAVEKDGQVTAIWEMQGRKHLRTIDPRSRQGQEILRLYTTEHPEESAG